MRGTSQLFTADRTQLRVAHVQLNDICIQLLVRTQLAITAQIKSDDFICACKTQGEIMNILTHACIIFGACTFTENLHAGVVAEPTG